MPLTNSGEPSGSSQSAAKRQKRQRVPNKKLNDGARISIDKVGDDGEPLEPIDSRRKFINQCGVLVRDMVPIILEE